MSYVLERSHRNDWVRELENLRKQVNDLKIKLRDQHHRREQEESSFEPDYIPGASSCGSKSYRSWERSCKTAGRLSKSPRHGWHYYHNTTLNAMSRALRRAARSPFSEEIGRTEMLRHFTRPPFTIYNKKTDPIEHVSHYIHMMSLYSHNYGLMWKVFPSSLGPTAIRWFNGLRKGSIRSFWELIQEFGVRFITCSKVPHPIDTLLSMRMRNGKTLRSFTNKYWELYNEMGEGTNRLPPVPSG